MDIAGWGYLTGEGPSGPIYSERATRDGAELVAIASDRLHRRPLTVAVDGHSAAGASTPAAAAAAVRLGATVVAGDDFYRDMPEAARWALSPTAGADLYFDWQRSNT